MCGYFLGGALRGGEDEVVSMDDFIVCFFAECLFKLVGAFAHDGGKVFVVVIGQAAGDLLAFGIEDGDDIAFFESTRDSGDAGG